MGANRKPTDNALSFQAHNALPVSNLVKKMIEFTLPL